MVVIEIARPGPPEVLVPGTRPKPAPGPHDVLIKVAYAGLNRADTLQRRGGYPVPPGAPEWPGLEVSGTVAATGSAATRYQVGDEVCALVQGGGYAEYCLAPEPQVLPVPIGLSLRDAAALPEACFTVWSNVFMFGELQAGERLLVHGGASGIGVTAIQLGLARGAEVYVTAGSPDKCDFCRTLGAKRAFDYRREDFVAGIAEATAGRGVDVILDMVGGAYFERNLAALAPDGRLVIISLQEGGSAKVDLYTVMQKRVRITGSLLRPRPVAFKDTVRQALETEVWPLVADGRVRAVVDRVFPLAAAAQAHAWMEAGSHKGKILLEVA